MEERLFFLFLFLLRHPRESPRRPTKRHLSRHPHEFGVRDCGTGRPSPEEPRYEFEQRMEEDEGGRNAVGGGKDAEAVDQVEL